MPLTNEQKTELDKIKYNAKTAKLTLNLLDKMREKILKSRFDLNELELRLEEIRIVRKRIDNNIKYKPFKRTIVQLSTMAHTCKSSEEKRLEK